jgi:hypothetical protein
VQYRPNLPPVITDAAAALSSRYFSADDGSESRSDAEDGDAGPSVFDVIAAGGDGGGGGGGGGVVGRGGAGAAAAAAAAAAVASAGGTRRRPDFRPAWMKAADQGGGSVAL